MKILTGIDVPFSPFGGSPIIANDWYSNLPSEHEVLFLTMPPSNNKKWWKIKNVRFLKTKKEKDPNLYRKYINSLNEEVKEIIGEFKPDIIHLQHVNFGLSRSFCEVRTDVPKLTICHGTDTQYAYKDRFFLDNLKYIASKSDILIFPTENMKNDFQKIYKKNINFEIIPHGIPKNLFIKTKIHKKGRAFKLLYAGRLNTFKGADIAIKALKYIRFPIKLDIYGREDEPGYFAKIKSLVYKNGLQDRVAFFDMVDRERLWDLLQNYDAIVIPSRKLEAFSITAIEAQARGLVVIYGNGGGIVNVVNDSGLQIKNNLPKFLSNIITDLNKKPEVLEEYRKLGYKNAKRYGLEKQISRLLRTSKEVISRKTPNLQ